MSEKTTIARPYATAAFEVALAKQETAIWLAMLQMAAFIVLDEVAVDFLRDPRFTKAQKTSVIKDVCKQAINEERGHFIDLLAYYQRLEVLPQIAELFLYYCTEYEKRMQVEVITAFALDGAAIENLKKMLKIRLQREIELENKIDESLIGGAIVRAGDFVIDSSVKSQLEKMKQDLIAD